jgi:hypothetical protein
LRARSRTVVIVLKYYTAKMVFWYNIGGANVPIAPYGTYILQLLRGDERWLN